MLFDPSHARYTAVVLLVPILCNLYCIACKLKLGARRVIGSSKHLTEQSLDKLSAQEQTHSSCDSRKIAENSKCDATAATGGTWSKVG
jgi:hypothetical protein